MSFGLCQVPMKRSYPLGMPYPRTKPKRTLFHCGALCIFFLLACVLFPNFVFAASALEELLSSSTADPDYLIDGEEVTAGSNPLVMDTDGDGLSDGLEIELGSSPILMDSDGDSMSDGEEVSEDLDPTDSSDCPRWYCGGGVLPSIFGALD